MSDDARPQDGSHPADLEHQITRALRSRATTAPDADDVAARIESRLADASHGPSTAGTAARRGRRVVVAGAVTSALAVTAAGAAAAANPYSEVARAVETVVQAVGVDWSPMPEGYTREQYDAFWGSEYGIEEAEQLAEVWQTDITQAKARVGQLVLDGRPVVEQPVEQPVESASDTYYEEHAREIGEFWASGRYDSADVADLKALWQLDDDMEVKARAGRLLLEGQPLPVDGTAPGPVGSAD